MEELIFYPNVSVGEFVLGDSIENYLHLEYRLDKRENMFSYDRYVFEDEGLILWVDILGNIERITCSLSCIWEGRNIVGMDFDEFLSVYEDEAGSPELLETRDVPGGPEVQVYGFEDVGFDLMVTGGSIATVMI